MSSQGVISYGSIDSHSHAAAPARCICSAVVLHDQLRDRLSQVPEESLRDLGAFHDAARHDRQVPQQVVTASRRELLAKSTGPVLPADFPTVQVRRHERPACTGPHIAQQLSRELLEMRGERGSVELVALQSGRGRRAIGLPGAGVAQTQNRPTPGRHVPPQPAGGIHLVGEVQDALGRNSLFRRHGRDTRPPRERPGALPAGTSRPRARTAPFPRCRPGDTRWRASERREPRCLDTSSNSVSPLREPRIELPWPRRLRLAGNDFLHRLFGLDPGSSAAGPTGALLMAICSPNRSASFTACWNNARHASLKKGTGPGGVLRATSIRITPPIPTRCIASRSAVIPSLVMLPFFQNQYTQGRAAAGGLWKASAPSLGPPA